MHPLFILSIIALSIWSVELRAMSPEQFLKKLEKAYEASRDGKKGPGLEEIEEPDVTEQLCISCPKISSLTSDVNQVLRKLAKKHSDKSPTLYEEINQLEGMYYLTIEGAWEPGDDSRRCRRFEIGSGLTKEENNFKEQYAMRLFDVDIDLEMVRNIQIEWADDESRVYFFRGKGSDRDKVVRVFVPANGKTQVAYFRINDPNDRNTPLPDLTQYDRSDLKSAEELETQIPIIDHELAAKEKARRERAKKEKTIGGISLTPQTKFKNENFQGEFGIIVDEGDDIPDKVTLLDVNGEFDISESVRVETKTKIDTSQQKLEVRVIDEDGKPYIEVTSDGDKTSYKVPIKMSVRNGWYIEGSYEGEESRGSREQKLHLDLISANGQVYTARVTRDDKKGDQAKLYHERDLGRGRISFDLGEDSQWVRYKLNF